jgi:hypothetical protein
MAHELYFAHWLWLLAWIALILPPFWKIFAKAGFSPWLALLVLVPLVNLIVLYVVAFSRWPALPERTAP